MTAEALLDYLAAPVIGHGIVSFRGQRWYQRYDVTRTPSGYQWGYDFTHHLMLVTKLSNSSRYPLVIVTRSFLRDTVTVRGEAIPLKAVRGHVIASIGAEPRPVAPDALQKASETDPVTGAAIPRDDSVIYL